MVSFSSDFYKNEKRDGFVISEIMKRSWAADLTVLQDIRDLCSKHSIHFFAAYGTLLGTVREGGYIPWDDDIDIGMVRDDYIAFLTAVSTELGDRYEVMNPYTKPWYCMNFTHISNNNDLCFKRNYLMQWKGCPFPVGPDVYPYYYIPRDPAEEQYIMRLLKKIDSTMALCRESAVQSVKEGFDASAGVNEATAVALVELQHETGFEFGTDRPLDNQLEMLYDQICRLTEPEDADYVARFDEYARDRSRKFRKEWLENVVDLTFEESSMPVPIAYDAVLKARFGENYMMPRNERGAHDYPFFKKQLAGLGERLDTGFIGAVSVRKDMIPKDQDYRSIVLFHTTVSAMMIYNEYVTEKIRAIVRVFQKHSDKFRFFWMAADFPTTDEMALDLIAPQLIDEYRRIVAEYKKRGGELVTGESEDLVESVDIYYGDEGELATALKKKGIPVIIQDYRAQAAKELSSFLKINNEELITSNSMDSRDVSVHKEMEYPVSWKEKLMKPDGSRKKVILYINSISTLMQYREKMLDKLRRILNIFYESKEDVLLVWHPQLTIERGAEKVGPKLYKEYQFVLEEYRQADWGILDESDDITYIMKNVDAFYGDADPAAERMRKAGKPVMIADIDV